jgi:cellulose synthase/poly-beta-1,6-N-acetylglucosamine synthase-like glycosyltransferase
MVNLFIYSIAFIGLAYAVLIVLYTYWFVRLKKYQPKQFLPARCFFSIIIPARNEALVIKDCLKKIQAQNYPTNLFEVIVVDDHSSDTTAALVQELQASFDGLHLIHLADFVSGNINAYKKRAIEIAAAQTKGDWIVTTDADCEVLPNWLKNLDQFIQTNNPVLVAAPVMFSNNQTWLGIFQILDFISLQGITAAAVAAGYHSMCNGANLAYSKKAFYQVGQFKGIDHVASGDDMLLMHKIKKQFPHQLGFLFSKDAIVTTTPMEDWKSFFNQRIRWASKAESYSERSIFWVLLLVYLFNAGLLVGLIAGLFIEGMYPAIGYLLLLKIVVEMIFLVPVSKFFNVQSLLFLFPFMQPFHIVYTVVAGWLGKFGTYQWKGRAVR